MNCIGVVPCISSPAILVLGRFGEFCSDFGGVLDLGLSLERCIRCYVFQVCSVAEELYIRLFFFFPCEYLGLCLFFGLEGKLACCQHF